MKMPWRLVVLPRTVWFAAVVEAVGLLLILAGLWIMHPIAGIIGAGLFFIVIAQGMQRGGDA
tara:strand:+ start:608 stop:793 length:186 start_codon:yes stop_codon:yes gene_type:complete